MQLLQPLNPPLQWIRTESPQEYCVFLSLPEISERLADINAPVYWLIDSIEPSLLYVSMNISSISIYDYLCVLSEIRHVTSFLR